MPKEIVKPLIAPPDIRKREGEPTFKSHQTQMTVIAVVFVVCF